MPSDPPGHSFLLSFDFEDWHDVHGVGSGDALARQVDTVLALLEELGARATFFVLGAAAEAHPGLLARVLAGGHELGCHGYAHARVYTQSPVEFRGDVERAVRVVEELTGVRPRGYRAPWFSLNRDTPWAHEILCDLGFRYDSSLYDSPRIPRRVRPLAQHPHPLPLASGRELWEAPVAVWRVGGRSLPVGGGSYWRAVPTRLLLHALRESAREVGPQALYLHPYELDPMPLRGAPTHTRQRARAAYRSAFYNTRRRLVAEHLRALAREHRLVPYGEGLGVASRA